MLKSRSNPVRQQEKQNRHHNHQQRDKQPQPTATPEQPLDVAPSIKVPASSGTRLKSSTRLGPVGNHHHHQNHRLGQTGSRSASHRQTKYKSFSLHSIEDRSLNDIIEYVSSNSLNRFRTCVVTVISKTPLDESVRDYLAQTILESGDHPPNKPSRRHPGHIYDERCWATCQTDKEEHNYETQVRGQADFDNGLVVLTLDSYMNANNLLNLGESMLGQRTTEYGPSTFDVNLLDLEARVDENGRELRDHGRELENLGKTNVSPLLRSWPEWNQNLIKTLLVLFTMSHIVVLYNPELSIDYSLIQTLKVLETLRIKSMNRISDLLEIVGSSQIFSQQWTRNCRISCPRALFVCDTSYIELNIDNCSNSAQIRDELEEQIYMILKRANLITGNNHNLAKSLFCLPDHDDFVFIINGKSLDGQRVGPYSPSGRSSGEKKPDSDESQELLRTCSPDDVVTHVIENKPTNHVVNQQHVRLRKFMSKHISSVRASAAANQDHDSKQASKLHGSITLPRFDDYFNIMLRLKMLLFPLPPREEGELITVTTSKSTLSWQARDERRFVDIYDLVDIDHLFSQLHCYKARLAAFELYVRSSLAKPHDEALRLNALQYYSEQARGPAGAKNLGLLESEISRHHIEIRKQAAKDRTPKAAPGKFIARTVSSDPNSLKFHNYSPLDKDKDNTLNIVRKPNGVIVTAGCECGRESSLIIKPNDRKKKLERVDVYRIND